MQITATIKVINEVKTGVSKSSGNPWKRQEIVLGWDEPYGEDGRTRQQLLLVSMVGKTVDKFEELECKVGDVITGDLDFETRVANNKVYNDIALYLI